MRNFTPSYFLLVLCILSSLGSYRAFGQYTDADYVLSSQAQVNAFTPDALAGRNLVIAGNDILNLSPLSALTSLPGALVIENNPVLTGLDALKNIKTIQGELRIFNNGALAHLNGFDSLSTSHSIFIDQNASLTTITGFQKLQQVIITDTMFPNALIHIGTNQNLSSIGGFGKLKRLNYMTIADNPKLQAIKGFQSLDEILGIALSRYYSGAFIVANNLLLTDISGFVSLHRVINLQIRGNNSLKNVDGLATLNAIGAGLTISSNALLENLDGLSNLNTVVRTASQSILPVSITMNPALTKPCGIYPIVSHIGPLYIGPYLEVSDNGFTMEQLLACGDVPLYITPKPSLLLPLNEVSGVQPVAYDSEGSLVFKRSPNVPVSTTNTPVKVGGANAFDFGVIPGNNYVESAQPLPYLATNQFTLTGWINCKSNIAGSGGNRIISWINNGGDGVDLVYQSNGSLRLGVDQWPDFSPASSSSNKVPTNASGANGNWVFFAVTYDRSTGDAKFYFGNNTVDATLDVTKAYNRPGTAGQNIGKLAIGSFNDATRRPDTWDRMFRGMIDNIHIFSSTLDLKTIVAVQRGVGNPDIIAPSAPSALAIASRSGNSFTLTWQPSVDNVGVKGYSLSTQTFPGSNWTIPGNVTSFVIDVPANSTQVLSLTAFDAAGNSSPESNHLTITTTTLATPLVRLRFNEGGGVAPLNSGSAPATFSRSQPLPQSVTNVPVYVGGSNALDFGAQPGNNYVQSTAPIDALKNLNAFTLTGWVNVKSLTTGSGGNRIVSWINNGGEGVDLVYQSDGSLRLGVDGWPDWSPAVSSPFRVGADASGNNGNWIFFAVTYRSSGEVQYYFGNNYVDAQLDVTLNYPTPGITGASIGKLAIGAFNDGTRNSSTLDRMLRGMVDDIQIFGSALSPESIIAVQRTTDVTVPPNPGPNPLVKLPFNESGGNFTNVGSIGGTFVRSSGSPTSSANTPSIVGGANSIDFGTSPGNYFVQSPAVIDGLKNLNAFTLTGWLNCRSNVAGSGGNRIISWINNGGEGVDLVYQSNGSLRLGVDGWPDFSPAFSSASKVPTNASAPANNWVFFAVTYKSDGQVQFYFGNNDADAALDVVKTYAGPGVTGSNISKLAIGAFNDATRWPTYYDRMFRGLIDEVQVFSSVLTPTEIVQVQGRRSGGSGARLQMDAIASSSEGSEVITELFQNFPNPFQNDTQIGVSLRQDVKVARITVNDLNGRPLKNVDVVERGEVQVTIPGNDFQSGVYIYSLIVDGKTVGMKRMIVIR